MKFLLRKLRRLLRDVLLVVQLLLWLISFGEAVEPVQTAAPARAVPPPDSAGVSTGPPIG